MVFVSSQGLAPGLSPASWRICQNFLTTARQVCGCGDRHFVLRHISHGSRCFSQPISFGQRMGTCERGNSAGTAALIGNIRNSGFSSDSSQFRNAPPSLQSRHSAHNLGPNFWKLHSRLTDGREDHIRSRSEPFEVFDFD